MRNAVTVALLLSLPSAASAASIAGTITQAAGGAPLPGMQVRAWVQTPKGWIRQSVGTATAPSAGDGTYALSDLPAGTYKVDARMPDGYSGNYGDRWYDVLDPVGFGYVPEDADPIVLADADAVTGVDIALEVLGGFDGLVVSPGGTPLGGMQVRAEEKVDPRIHHNDITTLRGSPSLGYTFFNYAYAFRGLPPEAYRLLVHDPVASWETAVSPGPVNVTPGSAFAGPVVPLAAMTPDPREPNESPADPNSAIDQPANPFRESPPQAFTSAGALVGPLGAHDVDWYCWDALVGDRYLVKAYAKLTVEGTPRDDPWVDPVIALFGNASGPFVKLAEDDDSLGGLSSYIDAEIVPAWGAGRYCVAVSTYGDTAFDGSGQTSAGRYELSIAMGNRRPRLAATYTTTSQLDPTPVPTPPAAISANEGETLTVAFDYSDPDGDPLAVAATVVDKDGNPVSSGALAYDAGAGTFTWPLPYGTSDASPYVLTLSVADAEFTIAIPIDLQVLYVNVPPTTPAPGAPADGAKVTTFVPDLVVANATDQNPENVLTYEFELYYGGTSGAPDVVATAIPQGATGTTTYTASLPISTEDVWVYWRTRSNDGAGGVSTWSAFSRFFVDTQNDPPLAADILKPLEGDTILVKRPALESSNPADPEGDAIRIVFEVATDAAFSSVVVASPPVDANTLAGTTTWTVSQDLVWGTPYYARAHAIDALGLAGPTGVVRGFQLAPNLLPAAPVLGGALGASCTGYKVETAPTSFEVPGVTDPNGDAVTIELGVFGATDDPSAATPLAQASAPSRLPTTTIAVPDGTFQPGATYLVAVRAWDGTAWTAWTGCALAVNAPPQAPALAGALGASCAGYETAPAPASLPVSVVADPDGDPLTVTLAVFAAGADPSTATAIAEASAAAQLPTTTLALPAGTLQPSTTYVVATRAYDGMAFSAWSACSLRIDALPPAPTLAGALGASCAGYEAASPPTSLDVTGVVDPDADPVTIELAVFAQGADPSTATPLAQASAAAQLPTTPVAIPAGALQPGGSYVVAVRAYDGIARTAWTSCALKVAAPPQTGGGGGGGCGCGGGPGTAAEALLGLVAALAVRRRRRVG